MSYDDVKVYVGNLPNDIDKRELEDEFDRFGRVSKVWVACNPPGFAFVHFEDIRDAEDAVRELHDRRLWGGRIRVELSRGRDGGRRDRSRSRGRGDRRGPPDLSDTKCFNCNQFGHFARDCTKDLNKGECYNCGKMGHQSRDCPEGGGSGGRSSGGNRRRSKSCSRSRDRRRRRSRSKSKSRSRSRIFLPAAVASHLQRERSLNRLPADVLSYVFELSVSRLEKVAPLARVSKLFNACVKRPNVLGGLELSTYERLQRLFPDLGWESNKDLRLTKAAASAELVATLQQVRSGYAAISRIDVGDYEEDKVTYVTNEHVRLVASFPSLRSVSLAQCVSVTDISPLQSLTSLTKLNLYGCKSISGAAFACLSSLTSLQELNVGGTAINDEGLAGLSRSLPALTKLNLRVCNSISGAAFACLSSLTSLQELNVGGTAINDEGLAGLSRSLPALTKLNLRVCNSISGAAFACLSSLTSLQELNVSIMFTDINDEGLAGLRRSLPFLTIH